MKQFAFAFVVVEKDYDLSHAKTVCNVNLIQHCGIMEARNTDEATGKVQRLAQKFFTGKQVYVKIGHPFPQCVVSDVEESRIEDYHESHP